MSDDIPRFVTPGFRQAQRRLGQKRAAISEALPQPAYLSDGELKCALKVRASVGAKAFDRAFRARYGRGKKVTP